MKLSDSDSGKQWLSQFQAADRQTALILLDELLLVGRDTFVRGIHGSLDQIATHNTSGLDLIGTLDTGPFGLREACNKIIHAAEVRPIYDSSEREIPLAGTSDRVWALRGEIELAGKLHKKQWNAVLYIPPFLEIVLDRIAFGWRAQAKIEPAS